MRRSKQNVSRSLNLRVCLWVINGCIIVIIILIMIRIRWKNAFSHPTIAESREGQNNNTTISRVITPRLHSDQSLLFMTVSYDLGQLVYVQRSFDCLRDICNAGWNVTILWQVSNGLTTDNDTFKTIQDRIYCTRLGQNVPIHLESFGRIGFGLNSRHRAFISQHIHEYSYFAYAEEDMLLTHSHLVAYIEELNTIKEHFPITDSTSTAKEAQPKSWLDYQIGFFRYEDRIKDSKRVTWEYFRHQIHIVEVPGLKKKYLMSNNLNQVSHYVSASYRVAVITVSLVLLRCKAIFIFPQEQIVDLEARCQFLTKPGRNDFYIELRKYGGIVSQFFGSCYVLAYLITLVVIIRALNKDWKYMSVGVSEWSSSFQQVLQCGLLRIVPVEHYQLFMIHHSTDLAQRRRKRDELLTMQNWTELIGEKILTNRIMDVSTAYKDIIVNQYNLNLIDESKIKVRYSSWWH